MSDSEEDTELKDQGKLRVDVQIDAKNPMQFVIKPNTAFNKVFTMFCEKYGLDIRTIRFMWDGARIQETEPGPEGKMVRTTPKMKGWEAGHSYVLQANNEATGG